MNINKAIVTMAAVFAATAVCHGALVPSSSASGGSSSSQAEYSEQVDLSSLEAGDTLTFTFLGDVPETLGGYEVLTAFLPDGVMLEWTGKKLKAPKAGTVKYSKKDDDFVDTKDSDNPSGLTVTLGKKKRTVSGTFKIYVAKSSTKVKAFTAKFSGTLGSSMKVTVLKKTITTAVIE